MSDVMIDGMMLDHNCTDQLGFHIRSCRHFSKCMPEIASVWAVWRCMPCLKSCRIRPANMEPGDTIPMNLPIATCSMISLNRAAAFYSVILWNCFELQLQSNLELLHLTIRQMTRSFLSRTIQVLVK